MSVSRSGGAALVVVLSLLAVVATAQESSDSVFLGAEETGRLVFDGPQGDFACRSFTFGTTRFVDPLGAPTNLWQLTFRAGVNGEEKVLVPSLAKERRREKTADGVRLVWEKLDLDAGDGAVDVFCDVTENRREGRFEFRIAVENRSTRFGLFDTDYPKFSTVVRPGKGTFVHPGGNWGGERRRNPYPLAKIFPDYDMPVQFAMFDADAGDGVMIAALDAEAWVKHYQTDRSFGFSFLVPAKDAGQPGAKGTPPFAVALYPYHGDWWKGAKHYRRWAEGAKVKWLSRGRIADRRDFPESMRNGGLWLLLSDEVPAVEKQINRALEKVAGRTRVSVHWYDWGFARGDPIYPQYFPAHPDFSNAVRRCVAKGVQVMPYMNARIWGHPDPDWPKALPYACHQPDGSPYVENWRKKDFSAMCQSTRFWRDNVMSVADRLFGEFGANALYLDQVASMKAVVCYAADHGHPVGGGSHWVDGYRQMVEEIHRKHPDKPLTSENFSEPYADVFDAFLLWAPNMDTDVPFFPAVYSGYYEGFACTSLASFTLEAFRAAQGRAFLWGCQGGWLGPWILSDSQTDKFEYLVSLAELRGRNLEFFSDGELMGEVANRAETPMLDVKWVRWGKMLDQRVPAVQAVRWRSPSGAELVAVANYSDKPQRFDGGEDRLRFELAAGEIRLVK